MWMLTSWKVYLKSRDFIKHFSFMKKINNTYYKRIFWLLLIFISFPIILFSLYSNNEGWGIDACPNMRNCIIDFTIFVLPLFWLLFSIVIFSIDFWKNKILERRISTACFLVICLFMVINILQKYIIANHMTDITYNGSCSYITPDFAHKLPLLSMWWFILSIILWLWSYFCFSSVKWKNAWIKVLKIIVWIFLLISWIYCFLSSI